MNHPSYTPEDIPIGQQGVAIRHTVTAPIGDLLEEAFHTMFNDNGIYLKIIGSW